MRFEAPLFLVAAAAIPLVVVIGAWLADRRRARSLSRFAAAETLAQIVREEPSGRRRLGRVLVALGASAIALALARPQWGERAEPVSKRAVDVVFAVDCSLSMLAEDLKPNRLSRAKRTLSLLVGELSDHRLGLVSFARSSHVLCPLTFDEHATLLFLDAIDAENVTRPGTALAGALETAVGLFPDAETHSSVVVMLSDGEDHGERLEEVGLAAARRGVVVHTLGFGTRAGEPIPLRSDAGKLDGYKHDSEGRVVLTRLDADRLKRLAEVTGGRFVDAADGDMAVNSIVEAIGAMERRELETVSAKRFAERYQVFLAAGLALLGAEAALGLWPTPRPRSSP